jgi:hypothetical protein
MPYLRRLPCSHIADLLRHILAEKIQVGVFRSYHQHVGAWHSPIAPTPRRHTPARATPIRHRTTIIVDVWLSLSPASAEGMSRTGMHGTRGEERHAKTHLVVQ